MAAGNEFDFLVFESKSAKANFFHLRQDESEKKTRKICNTVRKEQYNFQQRYK